MTIIRRLILALILCFGCVPAFAAGGGNANGELFVKIPTVLVEFWDQQGVFHVMNCDLVATFKEPASLNKKAADKIVLILSSMSWEEFSRGNTAATVKAVALDVLRDDPGTAKVRDILIAKMMIR